jgi:hypothetical protein
VAVDLVDLAGGATQARVALSLHASRVSLKLAWSTSILGSKTREIFLSPGTSAEQTITIEYKASCTQSSQQVIRTMAMRCGT